MAPREVTEMPNGAKASWSTSMVDPRQFVPIAGPGDGAHRGVLHGLRDAKPSISGLREWTVPMSENAGLPGERTCPFSRTCTHYANRIARGHFSLDGTEYSLPINDPPNSLHGGAVGFDKVLWKVVVARLSAAGPQLALEYESPDGDQGYPGKLHVTAVYTLTDDDSLRLDYTATTNHVTVVNLTQHSYFNLRGSGDILGHVVEIPASYFTPVDATLIPTGELRSVAGSPFDFRTPTAIGARIEANDEELHFGHGYDHNWIIDPDARAPAARPIDHVRLDARVYEPDTGRVLEVLSTQPGLQFYSGNFLDGSITGKSGRVYERRAGFCLEPQHFPDSPNHANFPSTVLKPGTVYRSRIEYRFSTRP
jgi:aldose 1-epimerase